MMIELACPRCDRSLSLPDEQRGQYAVCKHCEGQIWVPADASPTVGGGREKKATGPPIPTPVKGQTLRPNKNLIPPIKPKASPLPVSPQSPSPPAGAAKTPPANPTINPPADNTTKPTNPVPPPQPSQSEMSQHSSRHYAKLITAEPAQSRLAAASDGQLPKLALESKERNESRDKSSVESNRWLTLGVVFASLLISSVLLLFETGSAVNSQAETRNQILMRIQEKYFGPDKGPWPRYQGYLRNAALARSQGDLQDEERYYRKVLHLLNAQHLDKTDQGVTGLRKKIKGSSLKSDQELMELLSALLKSSTN